jgi:hypothetical protein
VFAFYREAVEASIAAVNAYLAASYKQSLPIKLPGSLAERRGVIDLVRSRLVEHGAVMVVGENEFFVRAIGEIALNNAVQEAQSVLLDVVTQEMRVELPPWWDPSVPSDKVMPCSVIRVNPPLSNALVTWCRVPLLRLLRALRSTCLRRLVSVNAPPA